MDHGYLKFICNPLSFQIFLFCDSPLWLFTLWKRPWPPTPRPSRSKELQLGCPQTHTNACRRTRDRRSKSGILDVSGCDVAVRHATNQLITTAYSNIWFQKRNIFNTSNCESWFANSSCQIFIWKIWLRHGFQLSIKSDSLVSPRSLAPVPCNSCSCSRTSSSSCHSERSSSHRASRPTQRDTRKHFKNMSGHAKVQGFFCVMSRPSSHGVLGFLLLSSHSHPQRIAWTLRETLQSVPPSLVKQI